ncbi:hypothetical protein WA026_014632 [Henosepilachna vigintioctopunctata]|uniref:tRNA-queuosine alpha-mannosyltransferase n=1 Tax=Henosepilachna vigintioctopunctata TaxID=420089 RepID=A0AAW1VFM3_9CUCU
MIPEVTTEKVLFCSSVLNLAEMVGMRPDLSKLKKIIYFHENQLIYPVREIKKRDIQYSYNQITSSLTADVILFNSHFNRNTFLDNLKSVLKMIPDFSPKNLRLILEKKSSVLYFPIHFPVLPFNTHLYDSAKSDILTIVWPHRWEFDKGPDDFFEVMFRLKKENIPFKLLILGECFNEIPKVIIEAKTILKEELIHSGYLKEKEDYFEALSKSHVAVSTSKHEFFGVAMLEAVYCGCFPLVPNDLVYPEIYPASCLYTDVKSLYAKLKSYCANPKQAIDDRNNLNMDICQYSAERLVPKFLKILS